MLIVLLSTLLTLLPHHQADARRPQPSGVPVAPANGATVDLGYGKYKGVDQENGVSYWLGMRYAKAPVDDLRFALPQAPDKFDGVQPANMAMKGCVGVGPKTAGTSEDCLSVDVHAPSNPSTGAKLPVYLYIQGGGLNSATSHPNATGLVLAANKNIIVASITYRTGIFGFLASKELQAGGLLNLGLKDQRFAMQWVHDHIAQFGGDPGMVILGGQSAGAGCVASHLTAYGGNTSDLFHGAVMQSQSMPAIRSVESSQYQFDKLAERVGCQDSNDKLSCLRNVDHDKILSNARVDPFPDGDGGKPVFAYNTVIDHEMIAEVPIASYKAGTFAKIPMIFGDVTDEGTIFTPRKLVTSGSKARGFLKNTYPKLNDTSLGRISELYGFDTTSSMPAWQKASQAYGDIRYTCAGVQLSDLVASHSQQKVWNYRYDVLDPVSEARGLNVSHGSDLRALFSNRDSPASQKAVYSKVVPVMQGYWTSFITTRDPNLNKFDGTPEWKAWNATDGERLHMANTKTSMESLTSEQTDRCAYLATISTYLEQ